MADTGSTVPANDVLLDATDDARNATRGGGRVGNDCNYSGRGGSVPYFCIRPKQPARCTSVFYKGLKTSGTVSTKYQ